MKNLKNLPLSTHWKIYLTSFALGTFIGLMSSQFSVSVVGSIGMIIGIVLIVGAFTWQILFLKCPRCGFRFHMKRPLSNHCPDCGERIR